MDRAQLIDDLERQEHDLVNYGRNLINQYKDHYELKNKNSKEVYAHVRALYVHLKSMIDFCVSENHVAHDIINDWKKLNDHLEADDALREHWAAILVSLKMMDS